MSIDAIKAVLADSEATGSARLVLLVLAEHADDDGVCWPSIALIARECRCSKRYVIKMIQRLEAEGEVIVDRSTRPSRYHITVHKVNYSSLNNMNHSSPKKAEKSKNKVNYSSDKVNYGSKQSEHVFTRTTKNHQEPPIFRQKPPAKSHDEIVLSTWNEIARQHGLPEALKLTEPRRRKLKQRIKEAGSVERLCAVIRSVPTSAFLLGKQGRGEWRASLDFVLQASSFTKLCEGAYQNTLPDLIADPAEQQAVIAERMRRRERMVAEGAIPA